MPDQESETHAQEFDEFLRHLACFGGYGPQFTQIGKYNSLISKNESLFYLGLNLREMR
jgi:hypothetical protein